MVLLPGPTAMALSGPPSSYALGMRPWLIFTFSLLLPVAFARFVMKDFIGGFFLILTAGIGWYAVKGSMDMAWLLCLAVVLGLNAIFDAFILLVHALGKPMFGEKLGMHMNIIHGLLFFGPVAELLCAILCWRVYREHLSHVFSEEQMDMNQGFDGYGAAGGSMLGGPSHGGTPARPPQGFEPFRGQSHRLSD